MEFTVSHTRKLKADWNLHSNWVDLSENLFFFAQCDKSDYVKVLQIALELISKLWKMKCVFSIRLQISRLRAPDIKNETHQTNEACNLNEGNCSICHAPACWLLFCSLSLSFGFIFPFFIYFVLFIVHWLFKPEVWSNAKTKCIEIGNNKQPLSESINWLFFPVNYNCGCRNLLNFICLSRFYRCVRLHSEIIRIIYSPSLFTLFFFWNKVNDSRIEDVKRVVGAVMLPFDIYHITYSWMPTPATTTNNNNAHVWNVCNLGSLPPLPAWMFNIFQMNEMRIE